MGRFHWGWRIGIVYSAFALATLGFVFFAFTQEVDLVRDDYYEYSLQHDQRMQARQEASRLSDAGVELGDQVIHVHLPSNQVSTAHGQVVLYRASSTTSDRKLSLDVDATGTMTIPIDGMASGKWIVTVTWKVGETIYEIEQPIEVHA